MNMLGGMVIPYDPKDFRKEICLVVPTIRKNSILRFLSEWNAIDLFQSVDLMLMEDNPSKTFQPDALDQNADPSEQFLFGQVKYHYSWQDIENELGTNSWIIPRRSDTVRSFAYWKAWKLGYKYILTLDDDCYPPRKDEDGLQYDNAQAFVSTHLKYLAQRSRWFNTLNSVKPRGIPFYNIGQNGSAIVNHGLWTNVLDYDAPTQLAAPTKEQFSFDNDVVPSGWYFPMCGMNVMWRAEATVLMYHLLMGQKVQLTNTGLKERSRPEDGLQKLPFDRFGDIWCGILMKKIADLAGLSVSTGMPYIRHDRASNAFVNLKKEANGLEVNEKFWEYVDKFDPSAFVGGEMSVKQKDLPGLYYLMGSHIVQYNDFPEYKEYFEELGRSMMVWAALFFPEGK